MEFDLENPLTHSLEPNFSSTETPTSLFLTESDHMPSQDYFNSLKAANFDLSIRQEALSLILRFSGNLDPFLSYLAVNYLDRFLSTGGMLQPKPWVLKLLAISCVSLAAKMKTTQFSLSDFQVDGGIVFDTQTVERMEYLILGALKWRMRSVTPFCFLSFLIFSVFSLIDPSLIQALKSRATEIIFKSQYDINVLEFKPSIVAASALLSASHELLPLHFSSFKRALCNYSYVNKERMLQCYNVIQEGTLRDGYESVVENVSSSETPVNVLDQQFSNSQISGDDEKTTGIIISSGPNADRDIKRRKIRNSNQTVQITHIQHCT